MHAYVNAINITRNKWRYSLKDKLCKFPHTAGIRRTNVRNKVACSTDHDKHCALFEWHIFLVYPISLSKQWRHRRNYVSMFRGWSEILCRFKKLCWYSYKIMTYQRSRLLLNVGTLTYSIRLFCSITKLPSSSLFHAFLDKCSVPTTIIIILYLLRPKESILNHEFNCNTFVTV